MALQMSRTVAGTGAVFPQAYGRIDSASTILGLGTSDTSLTLNWYVDGTAAATKAPVDSEPIHFDTLLVTNANPPFAAALAGLAQSGKIACPLDALKGALYCMLKQLPAYAGALDV